MLWIRFALREILNNKRFSLFFITNLSFGLVGFIFLNSFNLSLNEHFQYRLKNMLTGDFSIQSYYPINNQDLDFLNEFQNSTWRVSRQNSFLTIVKSNNLSRLFRVNGISSEFPLYGTFRLKEKGRISPKVFFDDLVQQRGVWLNKYSMSALEVKVGDEINIGKKKFIVLGEVIEEPGDALDTFNIAPTLYINISHTKKTGLFKKGSRVQYIRFFKINPDQDLAFIVQRISEVLKDRSLDKELFLITPNDAGEQIGFLIKYISKYLGFISIIALFLSGVGSAYLFQTYLNRYLKHAAILMSNGAPRLETYLCLFFQILLLGLVAAFLSIGVNIIIQPVFPLLFEHYLPENFVQVIDLKSCIMGCIMGTLGSFLFSLPVFSRIRSFQPVLLFQDRRRLYTRRSKIFIVFGFIPSFIFFWLLAVYQANSWSGGSWFILFFIATLSFLGIIGYSFFLLLGVLSKRMPVHGKMAFRSLYRSRMSALSSFLAISVGAFLMNLIPQIQHGLKLELEKPNEDIPGFILFDIQETQVKDIKSFLSKKNQELTNITPLVQSR